jgi:23S rRNA (guanosine2251-2'-O)-methyltransferase
MGRQQKTGWTYGLNPVMEALRSGRAIKAIYVSSGRRKLVGRLAEEAKRKGIETKTKDPEFFDSRFPKGHQGVAAETAARRYLSVDELLDIPAKKGEPPFFIIIDCVEDPRNLGAIIRSAEAAGVHGAVLQEHRSARPGPGVMKASAGAAEHLPVCMVPNIKNAIEAMKRADIKVIAEEAGRYPSAWEADLRTPAALVLGSEDKGIRKTVREKCDVTVSLPLKGKVNSLNTSVAAGIVIYEILRQNQKSP